MISPDSIIIGSYSVVAWSYGKAIGASHALQVFGHP